MKSSSARHTATTASRIVQISSADFLGQTFKCRTKCAGDICHPEPHDKLSLGCAYERAWRIETDYPWRRDAAHITANAQGCPRTS